MTESGDTLNSQLTVARNAYDGAVERLLAVSGGIYKNARDAADQILSLAEEYGADYATSAMLGDVQQFGELAPQARDDVVADLSEPLQHALDAVLEARDHLDRLTATREQQVRAADPARLQHVNINGREFVIDTRRAELRSVDNPTERYQLGDMPVRDRAPAVQQPTLTEQLAREHDVKPAQPSRDQTRTRGR